MIEPIKSIGDVFIWITSLLAGVAVLGGTWAGLRSYLRSPKDASLLGVWYTYGYFQSANGPIFYKERGEIGRHNIFPWVFVVEARPSDGDGTTVYKGTVTYHAPYLYFTSFEPIYYDKTFEIYCRRMDGASESKRLFGLHLGRSYDEGIHTACAVLMSRTELDSGASATRPADIKIEEAEFRRIIEPYFAVEHDSFQLLMFQTALRMTSS